jgi:hypothetical protein
MAVQGTTSYIEVVKQYDATKGELPEGITVDKRGNLYVSLNPLGSFGKSVPTVPNRSCLTSKSRVSAG